MSKNFKNANEWFQSPYTGVVEKDLLEKVNARPLVLGAALE